MCICPFITLISCSVYFGAGFVGTFLAGRVVFSACVRLCGVSGRYDLFECWPGVGGGAVRVFLFLGSVEVGTVRLK